MSVAVHRWPRLLGLSFHQSPCVCRTAYLHQCDHCGGCAHWLSVVLEGPSIYPILVAGRVLTLTHLASFKGEFIMVLWIPKQISTSCRALTCHDFWICFCKGWGSHTPRATTLVRVNEGGGDLGEYIFGSLPTLLLSYRRWLHWLKASHAECLVWTSGFEKTSLAPLIAPVVTINPLPLLYHVRTFYIVRYNSPTTRPSQPTYTFNELQKRKTNRGGFFVKTGDNTTILIDSCCFNYFVRNSLVALLEALFPQI